MTKQTLKRVAVSAATFTAMAAPMVVLAQLSATDLGLDLATEIGLGTEDIRTTVSRIIRAFMGLLGLVAVVIILLGGFKWMTAGGSEEKVSEAKKLIISGIIGLVIIMSAYAIANFVVGAVVEGTGG